MSHGCFYGFKTDRRGDPVNCWLKRPPAEEIGARLDILGRLMARTGQLDMFMDSHQIMRWYVDQFLAGNYQFRYEDRNVKP